MQLLLSPDQTKRIGQVKALLQEKQQKRTMELNHFEAWLMMTTLRHFGTKAMHVGKLTEGIH